MSDRLLHTKVSKRKPLKHFPKKKEGHDGDIQIVSVSGKGTYLCIKDKGDWKISDKFKSRSKFDSSVFRKIETRSIESPGNLEIKGRNIIMTPSYKEGVNHMVLIDANNINTKSKAYLGLGIDVDHTGITASGQTITNRGIDLDVNSNGAVHVGTVNNYGLDIDVIGGTDGTQNNYGIHLDVDGADTNIGMLINTAGTHIKLEANADVNDYATFTLADTGDLTIETVGSGTTDSDITLDADGDITLDAAGADVNFAVGGTSYLNWNIAGTLSMYGAGDTGDYFQIDHSAGNGQTILKTVDDSGNNLAKINLEPQGPITLKPADQTDVTIDKNTARTATGTDQGLIIDYDHTGIAASGQTVTGKGIELTMNCESVTHVGTVNQTGIDIDMVAATDGTQTNTGLNISCTGADTNTHLQLSHDSTNYCTATTIANGATTIATIDSDGAAGHLTLDPNGDLIISGADTKIDATQKLYLDGGGDTYIKEGVADRIDMYAGNVNIVRIVEGVANYMWVNGDFVIPATEKLIFDSAIGGHTHIAESADDELDITVGGDIMLHLDENGDDGNQAHFVNASVGFTQLEPTYDAANTTVDFRASNKQFLTFGSGNIGHVLFYFPEMSGNFVLLIKQDGTGSRTITGAFKVNEFDESVADGSAVVVWAGGSAPTLTTDANHVDILSFYWDADNEIAYGAATLDFQF
tara:strand:- start:4894 stop:6978 length:2085 start_codon:yes stop_codon:yes gene_type:complete